MNERMDFRFTVPGVPKGPVVELSPAEAERFLLKKLQNEMEHPTDALWQIAQFYKNAKQHEKALDYLRKLMALLPDVEQKANCVFTMGQAMENAGDYKAAVRYYREAMALEPASTFVWYFINNNLGFSLNTLGQFAEGETYCRRAIEIDPGRPNGHKNLGLSLSGQGDFPEAARCFVRATQVDAADPRSFHLLEELLEAHPELQYEFEDNADFCRKAVNVAARKVETLRPVVYRGWKKRVVLIRIQLAALAKRIWRFIRR
jgi:tetratricopeptide (TPR) repeat protein